MSPTSTVLITARDLERLRGLLSGFGTAASEALEDELLRAQVVPEDELPGDVVTMNSDVIYEDVATGARRTVRLVYPPDADPSLGRVSVLAPLGSALLGLRVGQEIEWPMPRGTRRLRIVAVPYQPEASGDLTL